MSLTVWGGAALVWRIEGQSAAQLFFAAYTTSFRTVLSLGLILGTALIVYYRQDVIPAIIERVFKDHLTEDYDYYKRRFSTLRISLTFSAEMILIAFVIFSHSQFPLSGPGEVLMLIAACAEYGLAVYVGRKLMYTAMMLHSLLAIPIKRNLFRDRELDGITPYVHVASTLTIIFLYVHMLGYYNGPFRYDSILGGSIKIFLLLLPLIATPVLLIFNFYPRVVLTKIYDQSIDLEMKKVRRAMRDEKLSHYEKRSYLLELNKMSRDELRYRLQLALTDLPIGITLLFMVLQLVLK